MYIPYQFAYISGKQTVSSSNVSDLY